MALHCTCLEQTIFNVVFQALLKTLDNIRVIIDNENIIRTRCEDIQNSESWLDVNVIDCDEFIFEGSGNETGRVHAQ